MTDKLNGAESLVHTLIDCGVETCFANPGTSEMHFVAALDRIPGIRCVLGLHETVVTGMADGYARIKGKPASTLLHCAPGLANGLANLHNARRARSPIVNIVGDHATYHRPLDAPLTGDTEGYARAISGWTRTTMLPENVGRDTAECVAAAQSHPGQVATLILPADASWGEGGKVAAPLPVPTPQPADPHMVETAARALQNDGPHGRRVLLLLGRDAMTGDGPALAHAIANATGAGVLSQLVAAHMLRGRGRWPVQRMPYRTPDAMAELAQYDRIILVGATPPVGFFAYPDLPSHQYPDDADLIVLTRPDQSGVDALQALADKLGVEPGPAPDAPALGPLPTGKATAEDLAHVVASLMPENGILCEETVSFGGGSGPAYASAAPHEWISLTGGAIGDGFPMSTGAAVAAGPDRRVISLQADGSGLYSLQALWTQARENLNVTTIILSNRRYQILLAEYANVGANPGPTAMSMLDLGNPDVDWPSLAKGFGVEGARAENLAECADLLRESVSRKGPFLIELMI